MSNSEIGECTSIVLEYNVQSNTNMGDYREKLKCLEDSKASASRTITRNAITDPTPRIFPSSFTFSDVGC